MICVMRPILNASLSCLRNFVGAFGNNVFVSTFPFYPKKFCISCGNIRLEIHFVAYLLVILSISWVCKMLWIRLNCSKQFQSCTETYGHSAGTWILFYAHHVSLQISKAILDFLLKFMFRKTCQKKWTLNNKWRVVITCGWDSVAVKLYNITMILTLVL